MRLLKIIAEFLKGLLFSGIFATAGGIVLYFSKPIFDETYEFMATAIQTEGVVVGIKESKSFRRGRESTHYSPVIQFIDQNGKLVQFISSVGSSSPSYDQGEVVGVLYQPSSPVNAKINSFFEIWFFVAAMYAVGLTFVAAGFTILFKAFQNSDHIQK